MALLGGIGVLGSPGGFAASGVAAAQEIAFQAGPAAVVSVAQPSQDPSEAVMIAAGRWVMERLPSGAASLDPHRTGAGKDGDRVRRVAEALGMRLATLEETRRCSDAMDPSTCQLDGARLLAIGAPRVSGDRAAVKVYAWYRSESPRQPVGQQEWELTLSRSGTGWRVVAGG